MVGPSATEEERDESRRRLKAGFVLLVGVSGTLIAIQGGASLPVLAAATLIGLVAGGVLLWYLTWIAG